MGSWRNLERLAVISRRTFLSASEGGLLATPPATEVQQLRRGTDQTPHECAAEDHWITSSARARSDGGIVRSSAFAVSRLITSSNFVGCSMGRARGNAPDNSEDQKEMIVDGPTPAVSSRRRTDASQAVCSSALVGALPTRYLFSM